MRFVTFQSAACDAPVSVQVSLVQAVGAKSGKELNDWIPDQSVLVMSAEAIVVHGSVAEVVAALEAAGAPAVAPVVEVAPTDLKLAAWVLDVVSAAIIDCDENDAVDDLSSTLFDSVNAGGHTHIALTALAARLRGAR